MEKEQVVIHNLIESYLELESLKDRIYLKTKPQDTIIYSMKFFSWMFDIQRIITQPENSIWLKPERFKVIRYNIDMAMKHVFIIVDYYKETSKLPDGYSNQINTIKKTLEDTRYLLVKKSKDVEHIIPSLEKLYKST